MTETEKPNRGHYSGSRSHHDLQTRPAYPLGLQLGLKLKEVLLSCSEETIHSPTSRGPGRDQSGPGAVGDTSQVRLGSGEAAARQQLAVRLRSVGLKVDMGGGAYLAAGDFGDA